MQSFFILIFSILCLGLNAFASESQQGLNSETPILLLKDIKPGMKGEWHTVIEGQVIKKFPLEVVDTVASFVGPSQPAIFCRGLDEMQQKIGTVAGMSGSPVYIDGKLIGAYAYGFPWPKDQALIGVSPIENMLKVLDYESATNIIGAGDAIPSILPDPLPLRHELSYRQEAMPLLLGSGGFSPQVLDEFQNDWLSLGFAFNRLSITGSDQASLSAEDNSALVPGAPVAAVLLGGDFKIAAVGTVTWKKGDVLLAMGHPFLAQGSVQIPMATASILDIVQSYETSFKLAKIGETVGSFFQDRLTAMAGRIGLMAPVTQLIFNVKNTEGVLKSYRGDLFHNRDLGPLVAAMALRQVFQSTLDGGIDQSYALKIKIDIEDSKSVYQTFYAYGVHGPEQIARAFLKDFRLLLNNRYRFPDIKQVVFDIVFEKGIKRTELIDAQIVTGKPMPGRDIRLQLTFQDFLGPKYVEYVEFRIPANRPKGAIQLRVGDLSAANDAYEGSDPYMGFRSFADIVDYLNTKHANNAFYVQLVQETKGIHFGGKALADLPRSLFASYDTPKAWFKAGFIDAYILDEVILSKKGVCVGGPCVFDLILDY